MAINSSYGIQRFEGLKRLLLTQSELLALGQGITNQGSLSRRAAAAAATDDVVQP